MDVPENLDAFLTGLLRTHDVEAAEPRFALDIEQRGFIESVLRSVATGSQAIFAVAHPSDRLTYLLLNTDSVRVIGLLAYILERTGEALAADVE